MDIRQKFFKRQNSIDLIRNKNCLQKLTEKFLHISAKATGCFHCLTKYKSRPARRILKRLSIRGFRQQSEKVRAFCRERSLKHARLSTRNKVPISKFAVNLPSLNRHLPRRIRLSNEYLSFKVKSPKITSDFWIFTLILSVQTFSKISIQIMFFRQFAQALGGLFGRDVALRHSEHFKTDHKFSHGRRPK